MQMPIVVGQDLGQPRNIRIAVNSEQRRAVRPGAVIHFAEDGFVPGKDALLKGLLQLRGALPSVRPAKAPIHEGAS